MRTGHPGTTIACVAAAWLLVHRAAAQSVVHVHTPETLQGPHAGCNIIPADLPLGAAAPRFDPAAWTIITPRSAPAFTIVIDDPANLLAPHTAAIQSNLSAACARWAQVLDAPAGPVTITVLVQVNNTYPRATGRSAATAYTGSTGGLDIYEQGAAYEVRTGVDPNGITHDAIITLNSAYVSDELWFDPDPAARTAPVPNNRTDAVSVFLHELGHVLAFNGWRDNLNGALPGNYASPFDLDTFFDGDFVFEGVLASSAYGAPVPLTFGNAKHVGNNPPRPGSDLIPDLMNGLLFYRGVRYDITPLDLNISQDCGVTLAGGGGGCDTIDFNRDELFPDTQDIDDFLSVFSGGACPTGSCGDVDFNNDGLFPDTLDIDALLSVFSGGACV